MVVETGAIPRDKDLENDSWHGMDMKKANSLLEEAGFIVSNK